ncbi:hypothetical protein C0Q58_12095 [Streptomyces albidoflavus]|nr:hypothetical protein C0Q58_12095 [Streptomyces albidoflavus]
MVSTQHPPPIEPDRSPANPSLPVTHTRPHSSALPDPTPHPPSPNPTPVPPKPPPAPSTPPHPLKPTPPPD